MLKRIPQQDHKIDPNSLDPNAIAVANTLIEAGFEAYLVGGCLRDLLVNETPKDFDVVTSAHPDEIRPLFKRCRLIGKRFRLAHVSFGRDIIEVATFRGAPTLIKQTSIKQTSIKQTSIKQTSATQTSIKQTSATQTSATQTNTLESSQSKPADSKRASHAVSQNGMLLRDNCYGASLEEDAYRRDFSMNALYLDPTSMDLLDFVGAVEDIAAGKICLLGEPKVRFQEDPVRALRAIRFEAKLGFKADASIESALKSSLPLLSSISPARRFEELMKFFLAGHAQSAFYQLQAWSALDYLLPTVSHDLNHDTWAKLFDQALINTDQRIAQGKPVTPAFLLAVFIWPSVKRRQAKLGQQQGMGTSEAIEQATAEVLSIQCEATAVPKRFCIAIQEMFGMQQSFKAATLKRCENLIKRRRFRAAYDFLLLREESGELPTGLGDWWTQYQTANLSTRKQMIQTKQEKRRRHKQGTSKPDKQNA